MSRALIALGANVGDRAANLSAASARIDAIPDTRVTARSSLLECRAIGGPHDQPAFLNAAVVVETALPPRALLAELRALEEQMGRTRAARWAARTIDLDLLLFEDVVCDEPDCRVPHPRMTFRRFALAPAAEIAADWRVPTTGWTIAKHLAHLDSAANYLAIAGTDAHLRRTVAARAAAIARAELVTSSAADTIPQIVARAPVISDFWFEQAEVCAQLKGFEITPSLMRSKIPQPKLLVVLESPSTFNDPSATAYHRALLERARQINAFPVYSISAQDEETAIAEVAAATSAMQ